jgi:hypothetical protein
MPDSKFPVYIVVKGEKVRIGWAAADEVEGFVLELPGLRIGGEPEKSQPARSSGGGRDFGGGGGVFPPYGRSKGQPIRGAEMSQLQFYADRARQTLADPSKSRWHDKERELLAALEAEMDRQGGGGRQESSGGSAQDDIPF